jgi:hypothetical protein
MNGYANSITRGEINGMEHPFWFSDKTILLRLTQNLRRMKFLQLL